MIKETRLGMCIKSTGDVFPVAKALVPAMLTCEYPSWETANISPADFKFRNRLAGEETFSAVELPYLQSPTLNNYSSASRPKPGPHKKLDSGFAIGLELRPGK